MSAEAPLEPQSKDYGQVTENIKKKIDELHKKLNEDEDDFGKLNEIFEKLNEIYRINSKIEQDINNIYNDQQEYYDIFSTENKKLLEVFEEYIEVLRKNIDEISRQMIKEKLQDIHKNLLKILENKKQKCEKIEKFIYLLNIVKKNEKKNYFIKKTDNTPVVTVTQDNIKEYRALLNLDIVIEFNKTRDKFTISSGKLQGSDIVLYLKDQRERGGSNKKRKTKIYKKRTYTKNKTIKKRR